LNVITGVFDGIAVKSDTASKDSIIFLSCMSMLEISSAHLEELGTERPLQFWRGDKMSARNFKKKLKKAFLDKWRGKQMINRSIL